MAISLKKSNFSKSLTTTLLLIAGDTFGVTASEGALFPAVGAGNPFRAVLWAANKTSPFQDATREIIECYRSVDDTFVVTARAQEGTAAKEWAIGTQFMLTLTAGTITEIETEVGLKIPYTGATSPLDLASQYLRFDIGSTGFYFDDPLNPALVAGINSPASGQIYLYAPDFGAILDMNSIATSDKTFTFPNVSGTIALTSDLSGFLTTVAFADLSDYPADAAGVLTNNGAGVLSWVAAGAGDMILNGIQSVTGLKTFDKDKIAMKGTSTGVTVISTANASATSYTATLQAADGTLAYTTDIPSITGLATKALDNLVSVAINTS